MRGLRRAGIAYRSAKDLTCGMTKPQMEEYAAACAEVTWKGEKQDLDSLLKALGGRIHYYNPFELDEDADTIVVHGPSDFDIVLSDSSSLRRDRFTIAHEVGHYVLHSNLGKNPLVAARNGSDRAEWEANWFAAGILMPKPKFEAAYKVCNSPSYLAAVFDVSLTAAEVRIKALELDSKR